MKSAFNKKASAKKSAGILGLAFAIALAPLPFNTDTAHARGCNPQRASIVIDAKTGKTLSAYKADELRYPASMTKIMTLMMVFDELTKGTMSLDDDIVMSKHAASMVPVKLGLKAGQKIKLKDAIAIVAVKSSNDLAVALAEAVGGTEEEFARLMTEKAKAIGMNKTVFVNASGLPDNRQVTTARDMATLSRHLIQNYQKHYHYFSKKSYRYKGRYFSTTNRLMHSYRGMDGIKTGYICASGFNLAASAKRGEDRIIGVTFGHPSSRSRNAHMRRILDKGFVTLRKQKKQQKSSAPSAISVSYTAPLNMGRPPSFSRT